MLNSDLSAMLSQHYVTYDVNVVITSRLLSKVFYWQISHAFFCFVSAFCFTCKHAETKLKQNNFTETKHCFAFVLFQFYFSYNHCLMQLSTLPKTMKQCNTSSNKSTDGAAAVTYTCQEWVMTESNQCWYLRNITVVTTLSKKCLHNTITQWVDC